MNPKKNTGIVLIIVGIGLAYSGYELSQTVGNQLGSAFSGESSESVVTRYVAGAISAAVGVFLFK